MLVLLLNQQVLVHQGCGKGWLWQGRSSVLTQVLLWAKQGGTRASGGACLLRRSSSSSREGMKACRAGMGRAQPRPPLLSHPVALFLQPCQRQKQ